MSKLKEFQSALTLGSVSSNLPYKEMSRNYEVFNTGTLADAICEKKFQDGTNMFEVREIKMRKTRKGNEHLALKGVHMLRLKSTKSLLINGDEVYPEMVIYNSYDGSSAMTVHVGIFRAVCSNGLVVATQDFGKFKVRHMGTEQEQAIELLSEFVLKCKDMIQMNVRLGEKIYTEEEMIELAKKAAKLRFDMDLNNEQAMELLVPSRTEDIGNDAWRVLNVLQEKVIGGGFKIDGVNKRKVKPIRRATEDLKINKAIYQMVWETIEPTMPTEDVTSDLAREAMANVEVQVASRYIEFEEVN